MIFNEEQLRRLEHVADGKPVPENEIDRRLPWDKPLTIDVPQDPRGTFKKPMTAPIWALVEHVKKHTSSAEGRVLAAGIAACIEQLTKLSTEPVRPEPTWHLPTPARDIGDFARAGRDLDDEIRRRQKNERQEFSSLSEMMRSRSHHWVAGVFGAFCKNCQRRRNGDDGECSG